MIFTQQAIASLKEMKVLLKKIPILAKAIIRKNKRINQEDLKIFEDLYGSQKID